MNKAFHKQHFYYERADISFSTSGIKVFWYCLLFFVLSAGGAFAAGEPGTLKWSFKTGDRIDTSPAIASDGTVYAGSNGNLYAVNSNGTLKWSFKIDDNHSSPVIGSDGTVYVVSKKPDVFSAATLYAVTADGKMKWTFETYQVSAPVIGSDDTIYVESSYGSGYLYALNPDGTEKWSSEAADFWHRSSLAIDSQGTIYMGTGTPYDDRSEGALYTFNLDGTLKWSFKTGKTSGSYGSPISNPAIGSDSTIYIVRVYDGTLYALNPDGTLKWSYKLGSNYDEPSPVIGSDGTIYVGSNRNLYAVKPDGKLKWTFRIGDVGSTSPAIGSDGTVYVGSSDGTLYAIYSDSYGLAKSPWPMFRYNAKHTGQAGGAFYDSGDLNHLNGVDLADAILALKVVCGLNPPGIFLDADVTETAKSVLQR